MMALRRFGTKWVHVDNWKPYHVIPALKTSESVAAANQFLVGLAPPEIVGSDDLQRWAGSGGGRRRDTGGSPQTGRCLQPVLTPQLAVTAETGDE